MIAVPNQPVDRRRIAGLILLVAAAPATPVGVLVCAVLDPHSWWIPAAGIVAMPLLLGFALGPTVWPLDEDRWAGTWRLAVAGTALWLVGLVALWALLFPVLCGAGWGAPALEAGLAVYAALAIWLVRDPDRAFVAWPAAVLAGLAVIALVSGLGPHSYCST